MDFFGLFISLKDSIYFGQKMFFKKKGEKAKQKEKRGQVFSFGQKRKYENRSSDEKAPTLVPILEGLEIVQVASGNEMILFQTSEGDVLEIGKYNKSRKPLSQTRDYRAH